MAPTDTTRTHRNRLLAVLLIAPFMAQADATIANVAAPSIHADLHTTGAELELVIGVFTGASLLCGLAPGPVALIAARVLQGAGAALMFPQALTGIQLAFEG